MASQFTVGIKLRDGARAIAIEAEDALIAALKAKHEHPEANIMYVRRSNRRGDRRHPHGELPKGANSAS